ncbi:MAG: hypothetical protein FJX76_12090 [Armatimonadetes bacterium]|nr:hypothetical protein [Armatimonadota bacterium]
MEITLGVLALENSIIDTRMFMALFTSMLCGPAMDWLLREERERLEATGKSAPQPDGAPVGPSPREGEPLRP